MSSSRTGLTAALALAGAAAGLVPTTAAGASSVPAPTAGGTLTLAYAAGAGCIDPHQLADATTITVARQFTDGLTFQDPDTGDITPYLAESWDISDDSTTFTFTLRGGATFSDGTPVDAAAVKANFDDIVALGARSLIGSSYLAGVSSIEAPDESTVVVTFDQPSAQFLQATSTATLGLLSTDTLAKDADARCNGDLVGSGPFVLSDYQLDQSAELTRRDDYDWAPPDIARHGGAAYLDEIVFQIIPEVSVRTGALESGQVQGVESVQPVDQPTLESSGYTILARSNPGLVNVLIPNNRRSAMADPLVRQALQVAIDRQGIVDTLYNDNYAPATSVLAATTPFYSDQSALLAYDPDRANDLLDQAGWVLGDEGIREKDGEPLVVKVLLGTAEFEVLQQQLKAVGVDLEIDAGDPAQYLDKLQAGDFDLAPYNLTRPDPSVLTAIFNSQLQNVPFYGPSPLDDLLEQLGQVSDPDQRADIATQVQQTLIEQGFALPTTEQAQVYGFAPEVQGLFLEASSRIYLYDTWLEG